MSSTGTCFSECISMEWSAVVKWSSSHDNCVSIDNTKARIQCRRLEARTRVFYHHFSSRL